MRLRHPLGRIHRPAATEASGQDAAPEITPETIRRAAWRARRPRLRLPLVRLARLSKAPAHDISAAPLAEQSTAAQTHTPTPTPLRPISPRREGGRLSLRRLLLYAFVLLLLGLLGAGIFAANVLLRAGGEPREASVFVMPGTTFAQVAANLEKQGLIHDAESFLLLVRLTDSGGKLRAGEFLVDASWKPLRVIEQLTRGQPILHRLQVREGLAWWEVGRLVEEAGLGSQASFERAVRDPALLARHGIPFATAEGYLFPDTYLLPRNPENDARPVVEHMLKEFWKTAREVWPDGLPPASELARLVVLASIVEKETGQGLERAKVAGVYTNRLRIGMAMQADPTVIYGIGQGFDGNLRKSDLENEANLYNTYRRPGLPPGPICSPGKASLEAAAHPEEHGFLYFVSRKDGTHAFSKTLDEHNANVRRFQLRRNQP